MRKVKKAAGILLALTLAASLVTGCGGSSSKAQEEKDTLTVAITGDPPTLDIYPQSNQTTLLEEIWLLMHIVEVWEV